MCFIFQILFTDINLQNQHENGTKMLPQLSLYYIYLYMCTYFQTPCERTETIQCRKARRQNLKDFMHVASFACNLHTCIQ